MKIDLKRNYFNLRYSISMKYPQNYYIWQKIPKQLFICMICFNIHVKMSFRTPSGGVSDFKLPLQSTELSPRDVWLSVTLFAIQLAATTVLMPQWSSRSSVYSRLSPDLSQVVEELRQVGLQQPLKLQAQRHNALQGEGSGHQALVRVQTTPVQAMQKKEAAYRWRGGDGVQPEEVAGVHFLEHAVQLGGLVVQEAQRRHCGNKCTTDTQILPQYASLFFIQGKRQSLKCLNFPKALFLSPSNVGNTGPEWWALLPHPVLRTMRV